jgi:hypothetical protein
MLVAAEMGPYSFKSLSERFIFNDDLRTMDGVSKRLMRRNVILEYLGVSTKVEFPIEFRFCFMDESVKVIMNKYKDGCIDSEVQECSPIKLRFNPRLGRV